MKTRVMSLLKTKKLGISIGTFHSICARLIRNEAKNIGLNPQFAIYDVQDQLDLYKVVLKVLNISKDIIKPNQARSQISFLKNKMITPEIQLKKARTVFDKKLVDIYKLYQTMLRENDALDFDDLLLFPLQIFDEHPKILKKLHLLIEVGLDYLHLGQPSTTLSGGEAQRIKLARELSKVATGKTFYILDEPTTGLHFDDVKKLLSVLNRLVAAGDTVTVIEHNLDVIKTADWIIDLGPNGGPEGGKVIAEGTPKQVAKKKASETGRYLKTICS